MYTNKVKKAIWALPSKYKSYPGLLMISDNLTVWL